MNLSYWRWTLLGHAHQVPARIHRLAVDQQPLRRAPPPWIRALQRAHQVPRGRAPQPDAFRRRRLVRPRHDSVDAAPVDSLREVPGIDRGRIYRIVPLAEVNWPTSVSISNRGRRVVG